MTNPTLTISLGLNGTIELIVAEGRAIPLQQNSVEQILLTLLKAQKLNSFEPKSAKYIPSHFLAEAMANTQVKKYTKSGKVILPEFSLADLDL